MAAEKYANDRYEELYKTENLKEFSDTARLSDFTDGTNEGFIKGAQWQLEQQKLTNMGDYTDKPDLVITEQDRIKYEKEKLRYDAEQQKQVVSDEEIEKLIDDNFKASLADNNGEPLYTDADLQQGFKSAAKCMRYPLI